MARPFWFTKFLVQSGLARLLPFVRRLADGGPEYFHLYSDRVLAAPLEDLHDPALVPTPGPDTIDLYRPAPRGEVSGSANRISTDRRGTPPLWGLPELRRAVADRLLADSGRVVDPEREIAITHGASAAFAAALDAYVNPGDGVVLFDPCSPLFSLGARSRRAEVRWVKTTNESGRCRFDVRALERAMRRAKVLALANPMNPTGAALDAEDIERIATTAAKRGVILYVDESFPMLDSKVRFAERPGLHLLTAGSVSQQWGLGSLRVGWLAGSYHLVKACALMANLHAPFVPTACQQIAARALEAEPALEPLREKCQFARDRLRMLGFDPQPPVGGHHLWVDVSSTGMNGRAFAERLMRDQRVLVGPGSLFGPSGHAFIRLSFAAEDGRLREGLARLGTFLHSLRGNPALVEPLPAEPIVTEQHAPAFSRA